jgi:hypothetical protein
VLTAGYYGHENTVRPGLTRVLAVLAGDPAPVVRVTVNNALVMRADDGLRTRDPDVGNVVLLPAELRPHW